MNITIYTSSDFPYGGAPENFVRQMTLGLAYNNIRIEVIRYRGSRYSKSNNLQIKCYDYLFKKPFQNEFFKLIELGCLILFVPFSLIYRKIVKKDDIILLYGLEYSYIVLPFIIWSKILKLKCFRIITDIYSPKNISPIWWKKPKHFFYNLQFKYFDRFLTGLIVLSSYIKRNAIKYKVNPKRIFLIPHFIDITENEIINQKDSIIRIGFFGTATFERGIYDLLDAFKIVHTNHPNTQLIISGKISNTLVSKIQSFDSNFKNNINITGYLTEKDLKQSQLSCNILVNPTKSGLSADAAFPTKLGEYFTTKNPVVSTAVGDLKEYFQSGVQLILVNPDSSQAIADGIEFLIRDKVKAKIIGENGYFWAKDNLDYIKNTKKMLLYFQNLYL